MSLRKQLSQAEPYKETNKNQVTPFSETLRNQSRHFQPLTTMFSKIFVSFHEQPCIIWGIQAFPLQINKHMRNTHILQAFLPTGSRNHWGDYFCNRTPYKTQRNNKTHFQRLWKTRSDISSNCNKCLFKDFHAVPWNTLSLPKKQQAVPSQK